MEQRHYMCLAAALRLKFSYLKRKPKIKKNIYLSIQTAVGRLTIGKAGVRKIGRGMIFPSFAL